MKQYLLPITHLIIFLFSISSPLWIDWKIVVVGFILYELQMIIFNGCVLSFWEFGSDGKQPNKRFITHYLAKIIPNLNQARAGFCLDFIFAPAVPIAAIAIQLIFNFSPLFKI